MTDLILIVVLAAIILLAARYVHKAKKSGAKCIGCPAGGCGCSAEKSSGCCCCHTEEN